MRKPLDGLLVLFAFLALTYTSCSKLDGAGDIDEVNWSPEVVAPLAHGKISLQDILDELDDLSFLEIDEDGTMRLFYKDEPLSRTSEEVVGPFPDFPLFLSDTEMSVPFNVIPGINVEKIVMKKGELFFEINSPFAEDIDVTITIPSLTKEGNPFQVNTTATYLGNLPATAQIDPVSIAGYTLSTNDGNLEMNYEARKMNGEKVKVNFIAGSGTGWEYDVVDAVWENAFFDLKEDAIEIDVFDNWVAGDINLADPRITIEIDNSFGFATLVRVNKLEVTTTDGNKISLESELLNRGISLDYPNFQEKGTSKRTSLTFDRNNSNIDDILNARPVRIEYDLVAEVNPESTTDLGFAMDDSEISTTVKVEIPIYGSAKGFTIENEADIDLDDFEDIEEAEFKIISNNAIPIDFDIQMYFIDANQQVLDSLFVMPYNILKAAAVDANGNVTTNSMVEDFIGISPSRFDLLRQSEKVLIQAAFSTYNDGQQAVRILSTQELDVKLGMKVKVK